MIKVISDKIRDGKRSYYICECSECMNHIKVRSDRLSKIKSCHPCHHKINRTDSPGDNYDWCAKCRTWKKMDCFNYRKDGRKRSCKQCEDTYRRKNQESITRKGKEWRKKNLNKVLFYSARFRAKDNGIPFNLEIEDIIIPTHCPVFGTELSSDENKNTSPSLDRIIPELGYTKGNVRVISWRANWIKNNASPEEIELIYYDSKKWKCKGDKSMK